MRQIVIAFFVMGLISGCNSTTYQKFDIASVTPFGICYAKLKPDQVKPYEMVIVEPDFYSKEEVTALKEQGTKIIAYATLGEVDPNRWYFAEMETLGFRGQNAIWNSFYIDLAKPEVQQIMVDQVVPRIMAKGFDGLFLDTIDAVSPETERGDLQPFMAEMIHKIRENYSEKIIIQNAGLFLLSETARSVDAFLTESLASTYNFDEQRYVVRSDSVFNARVGYLQYYVEESKVPYMILDYADSPKAVSKIKTRLDTLDKAYFISNIGLNRLPEKVDSVANRLVREAS